MAKGQGPGQMRVCVHGHVQTQVYVQERAPRS